MSKYSECIVMEGTRFWL